MNENELKLLNGKLKLSERELKLPNGKIITFNDEQFEGLKKINLWLKNDGTFFTLSGYAGTGKSSSIKKIIDDYRKGVAVSATTHKAKKIIGRFTGKEALTLHSLLGLRPDLDLENYNPNSPIFSPIAVPKICDYSWVIIDEASMINKKLFDLIVEVTKGSRTKILFLGDPAQLPPVSEEISPVFTSDNIEKHHLTKVERQKDDNPLLLIYDNLRNNLNSLDGGYLRKTTLNSLNEGIIFTIDKKIFRKKVFEIFSSDEYKKNSDYCKGLAWKNNTVMSSNKIVRDKLFGKNVDVIEKNDILMGYRSITDEKQRHNIIENSADYTVVEKHNEEENTYGIMGYRVKLKENLYDGKFKYQDIFIINIKNHDNLHLYGQMHDFFRDMGKSNKKNWKKYYEFRRCNILMKTIDKYQNGLYRPNNEIIAKDLDYGYFLTVHKSQGSTYTHTVVIESDINDNWNIVERNKLRYVAMSRSEKTTTMLTTKID